MRVVSIVLLTLMVLTAALPASAEEEGEGKMKIMPIATESGLEMGLIEAPGNDFAYLESTVLGDMDGSFGKLFMLAKEQDLLGEDTHFGTFYPTDLSEGVDETTPVYVGFSLMEGAEIKEPLKRGTIEAGPYLAVQHWGEYSELKLTYGKVYMWAKKNDVTLGFPTFEVYMNDPKDTPVHEWLTVIYFPCDADELKPMIDKKKAAGMALKERKEEKQEEK